MVFPYKIQDEETVGIQILPSMENLTDQVGHELDEQGLIDYYTELVKEYNQKLSVFKRIRSTFVRKEDFVRTTTRKIKRQDNPLTEDTIMGYTEPEHEL